MRRACDLLELRTNVSRRTLLSRADRLYFPAFFAGHNDVQLRSTEILVA